jgi:hypothetical protein
VVQEDAQFVDEGAGKEEAVYTRVYFLDRLDGEGSMIVKQTTSLAAARVVCVCVCLCTYIII